MKVKQRGVSLIELIAFIVVIGIVTSGALLAMRNVLFHSATPQQILQASHLAKARLNIILLARQNSFQFSDPCINSTNTACKKLEDYAQQFGYTINSQITNESATFKLITVNVSGNSDATISMRVANYETA